MGLRIGLRANQCRLHFWVVDCPKFPVDKIPLHTNSMPEHRGNTSDSIFFFESRQPMGSMGSGLDRDGDP